MNSKKKYRIEIAKQLGCSEKDVFLFWKGRVALFTALKALGVSEGDEVVLQAFTCVVVPNAIIYTGATPIYADVRTDSYNMSLESVKAKVTSKTKVVIIQNTFGLSSEVEENCCFLQIESYFLYRRLYPCDLVELIMVNQTVAWRTLLFTAHNGTNRFLLELVVF